MSERNQSMMASGSHPQGDLPELAEPLKAKLVHVLRAAPELEREVQAGVDGGHGDRPGRLTMMARCWADDLGRLISELQSSDLPLRTQALARQVLKGAAERIQTLIGKR